MNVLFLCGGYRSSYAGNFIPSLETLEKKVQPGKCIYVFHLTNTKQQWCKDLEARGATVAYMDFFAPLPKRVAMLMQLVKKHSVDIVHVHFGEKYTATICGYFMPRLKVIWHIHSDWSMGRAPSLTPSGILSRCKGWFKKLIGHKAVKLVVSKALAEQVGGIYVPNGLAINRVHRFSDKKELRKNLNMDPDSLVVLCLGWSPEVKGIDIAVNAIAKLRNETALDVRLVIVTGENDENVKKWIDDKTSSGSTASFIHYYPPTDDIYVYHNAADIFLSASRSEGFSYAICEALSIAKSCVCSDIVGVSWAKAFPSVTFFPSESIDDCAAAIHKAILTMHESEAVEQREKDACSVIHTYNADRWAELIMEIYRNR